MSVWLAVVALALIVAVVLVWPLVRRRPGWQAGDDLDYDLAVYRRQLAEIDGDVADGSLGREFAAEARLDIERQILSSAEKQKSSARGASGRVPAAAAVAVMIAAALVLYAHLGAPGVPSMTPASAPAGPAGDSEMAAMAANLARKLDQRPDDRQGWLLLARTYGELNRFSEAAAAYSRVLQLKPEDATTLALYGESLVMATQGNISKPARAAFEEANRIDPDLAAARYYLALHDYQNARGQAAFMQWLSLAKDIGEDAPARRTVLAALQRTARELGIDLAAELKERGIAAPSGPDADDVAAAGKMSGPERAQFIDSMVERLAARLASAPDDADGWRRLARAQTVLKRWDKAAAAYAQLARLEPRNVEAHRLHARMTMQAGGSQTDVPAAAQTAFAHVLRLAPGDGEALWFSGLGAIGDGRLEQGLEHWRHLLSRIPADHKEYATLKTEIERIEKRLEKAAKN